MVLAEAVGNESVRVARVVARSKGLGEVISLQGYAAATGTKGSKGGSDSTGEGQVKRWKGRSRDEKVRGLAQPWEGLMARKRTCQVCGWSEGVRMDSLGGMELSLPQYVSYANLCVVPQPCNRIGGTKDIREAKG
jgi:ubiquitin carboxyl-terminal hydrolase 1